MAHDYGVVTNMAHDTIQRAWDLIEQAEASLDRAAIASAERYGKPDALETWQAAMPTSERHTTKKEQRVSQSDMIAALARHEVAKYLRAADTVMRAEMRAHVQSVMEQFAEMIGEETGKAERVLREEIAGLRAELDALRSELREPLDLPKLKLIGEGR